MHAVSRFANPEFGVMFGEHGNIDVIVKRDNTEDLIKRGWLTQLERLGIPHLAIPTGLPL